MKTSEVIRRYKTQAAVARALGISEQAVSKWGEYPPPYRQFQLQGLTGGELAVEPELIPDRSSAA